jgi:hypothetical protein
VRIAEVGWGWFLLSEVGRGWFELFQFEVGCGLVKVHYVGSGQVVLKKALF